VEHDHEVWKKYVNASEELTAQSSQLKKKQSNKEEMIASVVYWLEFLVTDPEVPGSISGATRFS
jgi:hypothetical protein